VCFDLDSRPPIAPVSGGAVDHADVRVTAADGASFRALVARAAVPTGAGMIVLPDVRGLHPYYEELALRFAEAGIDAIAVDYFGRTAPDDDRGADFPFMDHVALTRYTTLAADVTAAAAALRAEAGGRVTRLHTVGFCFGGRLSFDAATMGLDLAGVVGFYGWPVGTARADVPAPADVAPRMTGRVLGFFGGADQGIPADAVASFETSLATAGVPHEIVTYPGAPHSFFDRKHAEFAEASADAWARVLGFAAGTAGDAAAG
jgi:carboxymethylenebutenolidase